VRRLAQGSAQRPDSD